MERKSVRKMVTILAFSVMCLTLVSVPTVSAQPNKPLRVVMQWDLDYTIVPIGWSGEVSGDITGDITVTLVYARWTGKEQDRTEHWKETWVITTASGEIYGEEEGAATNGNGRCNARGRITDATGDWEHLIGCIFHWKGSAWVTDPGPPLQVHCDLTMVILPSTGS